LDHWDIAMTQTRTIVLPPAQPAVGATSDKTDFTGCPWHDVKAMLRQVGLRPTRQRMALGWILFGKGDRHLTAEMLYEEATRAKVPVSLATIYNTLHQFTEVGLLRQVAVDGSKAYFDTNVSAHHHYFVEEENELLDIPRGRACPGRFLAVHWPGQGPGTRRIARYRPPAKSQAFRFYSTFSFG
jgi:Fur family iron response transcriptional regulator